MPADFQLYGASCFELSLEWKIIKAMSFFTFDTLRYANRLEEAGVTREQAAVHAETMAELVSNEMATKKEIEVIGLEMKNLESRLISKSVL